MEKNSKFFEKVELVAKRLSEWIDSGNVIHIISHYEADGIAASGIISKLIFDNEGKFHARFIDQLDKEWILNYIKEIDTKNEKKFFLFLDFGADLTQYLNKHFLENNLMLFDHHPSNDKGHYNFLHLNPNDFDIDGQNEISTSGLAYFVGKKIKKLNIKHAPLGLIGALGDKQDSGKHHSLVGLNELIIKDCKDQNLIEEKVDLRLFRYEGPIHVSLKETIDPYIPDLVNNEPSVNDFLLSINIPVKATLKTLNKVQKTELVNKLVEKVHEHKDLVGKNYTLLYESGILHDAREFSIVLNACGRMNFPSIGLAVCLGDRGTQLKEASKLYEKYRDSIFLCMDWARTPKYMVETSHIQGIIGDQVISSRMIEEIIYIAMKNRVLNPDKVNIGFAKIEKNSWKITAQVISKNLIKKKINLKNALKYANRKLKIESTIQGYNLHASVKIPEKTDLYQYVDFFEEFIQKLII